MDIKDLSAAMYVCCILKNLYEHDFDVCSLHGG